MANFEEMKAAGVIAREELVELFASMKPAEQTGAQMFVDWLRKNYLSAGYKQLLSSKYAGALSTIPTLKKE